VELAQKSNWISAGLGPRNLRVETAAVVAMTAALIENGEFEVVDNDSSES
jgi:16S rRNA U1498 N3-methylase RsmE